MCGHGLVEPAAAGQFVEEAEVDGGVAGGAGRGRLDLSCDADHGRGGLLQAGAAGGGGEDGHADSALGLFGQAYGAAEDIGAQTAPVAVAGSAAGEGERPV